MRIVLALLVLLLGPEGLFAQGRAIDWKGEEKFPQPPKVSEALVDSLGRQYYNLKFKLDPSWATTKGFHEYDDKLPTYFQRKVNRFLMQSARIHKRLDKVVEDSLSIEKWIDYKAILADIDTQVFLLDELKVWKSWPTLYADGMIGGIYSLLVSPEKENLESNLAARLSGLPEVMGRARENLTEPSRLHCQVASRSLRDFLPFLEDLAGPTADISVDPALIDSAAVSLAGFADYLDSLAVNADPEFALGYDNFIRLLDLKHMIREYPEDLVAYAEQVLSKTGQALEDLPEDTGGGSFDTTAALELEPADLLDHYRVEAESALAFIERRDLMTLSGGSRLEIAATPAFLRNLIPGYAYLPPGPLDDDQVGRFFVPLPDVLGPDAKIRHQRDFTRGTFTGPVIHETYPGHHLQLGTANRNMSFVRRLQADTFTIEGWALYCEELMAREGYGGNAQMRRVLEGIIYRAARLIVDVRMQTGEYSLEEAIEFMINETGWSRSYIEKEVMRYAVEPAQAMSYIIGKREIMNIRDDLRGEMGDAFTLKAFHDNLLSCGSIQLYLLRTCVLLKS
ncbi:MAG: DUF885 domain-containing protein [bacterium]